MIQRQKFHIDDQYGISVAESQTSKSEEDVFAGYFLFYPVFFLFLFFCLFSLLQSVVPG